MEGEGELGSVADAPGSGPVADDALVGDDFLDPDVDFEVAEAPNDGGSLGQRAAGGVGEEGADGVPVGDGSKDSFHRRFDDAGECEGEVMRIHRLSGHFISRQDG